MKHIDIYTDGSCKCNPGPGGWGAILRYNGHEKELHGFDEATTNNKMELTAVIMALKALKEPCEVVVTTDSKYVVDAITKGWAKKWQANGWRKADKKPAQNVELFEQLLKLIDEHNVTFNWIKGHAGHPENERCDRLAVMEYESHK